MSLSQVSREDLNEMHRRVRRAILSIGAQPPVAALGLPSKWAVGDIVRRAQEAYGYTEPKRRFHPTPRDLDDMIPVLGALARYKYAEKYGERDFSILIGRAYDKPWWVIIDQMRISASEKSLQRWSDRAVEKIINEYLTEMSDAGQKRMRA